MLCRWPCQCGLIALFMRRGLLNKYNLLAVRDVATVLLPSCLALWLISVDRSVPLVLTQTRAGGFSPKRGLGGESGENGEDRGER